MYYLSQTYKAIFEGVRVFLYPSFFHLLLLLLKQTHRKIYLLLQLLQLIFQDQDHQAESNPRDNFLLFQH